MLEKEELGLVKRLSVTLAQAAHVRLVGHQPLQIGRDIVLVVQRIVEIQLVYVLQLVSQHEVVEVLFDLYTHRVTCLTFWGFYKTFFL